MNPSHRSPSNQHQNVRGVNFICSATQAQSVCIVGDFNRWNPRSHPMLRQPDGAWLIKVELKHGHHRYAFMVDDMLTLDPHAMGVTRDDKGERVSLMSVS